MSGLINRDLRNRLSNAWTNWFDEIFDNEMHAFFGNGGLTQNTYPKVDVSSNEKELVIEAAVPGMSKDNLSVDYSNGYLTITGEKNERNEDRKYQYTELKRSKFSRTFNVPAKHFDVEHIDCKLQDGVLSLRINKLEKANVENVKKIEINS